MKTRYFVSTICLPTSDAIVKLRDQRQTCAIKQLLQAVAFFIHSFNFKTIKHKWLTRIDLISYVLSVSLVKGQGQTMRSIVKFGHQQLVFDIGGVIRGIKTKVEYGRIFALWTHVLFVLVYLIVFLLSSVRLSLHHSVSMNSDERFLRSIAASFLLKS